MSSRNVVFIDGRVQGHDTFVKTLSPDTSWHVLDEQEDGVNQIWQVLAKYRQLESIHVVSHGEAGTLYLGDTVLTADSLADYQDAFADIGAAIKGDGDLLLYGCHVAKGEDGLAFIESIAELTGAKVAASTTLSGPRSLGADSVLDKSTGTMKAAALDLESLPVTLSTAYGNGIVTTKIGLYTIASDMAVQADGKILLVGSTYPILGDRNSQFAIARYTAEGNLDTSFGDGGILTPQVGPNSDTARSVAVQSDGKILVAGDTLTLVPNLSSAYTYDMALVRYNTDGTLDGSFSDDGIVRTTGILLGVADYAADLAIQSDGKILLAGESNSSYKPDFTLLRYNSDGSLDTSFNNGNVVKTSIGVDHDKANSIVVQSDGKILVAGYSLTSNDYVDGYDFTLVRYNPDGSLDINFGDNGVLTSDISGESDYGYGVALQSDNKILLGGTSGELSQFTVVRYNTDGSLDTSFGDDGKQFGEYHSVATSFAIQATDGKILVAGSGRGTNSTSDIMLVRYNTDGSLDTTFSGDGIVQTDIGAEDGVVDVFVTEEGKILVGGSSYLSGADSWFTLVRYNSDGSLDTTFNPTSTDTTEPFVETFLPADGATSVAVGSDIVLTFSEDIQRGTGTVLLTSGSASGPIIDQLEIATSSRATISGSKLTINPVSDLANGTQYFLTLPAGAVKDLAGNIFAGSSTYDFTTVSSVDTSPPSIRTYSPTDGATSVAVGSDIVLTFNEDIQRGTGTVLLTSGSASGPVIDQLEIATSSRATISGSKLAINPLNDLANGTQYFLTLPAGAVQDLAGNSFAGLSTYDFTTVTSIVGGADTDLLEFDFPLIKMESVGLTPDGKSLVVKVDGTSITIPLDIEISFSDISKLARELLDLFEPIAVFTSIVNDKTEYILPELFTGPASLNLKYQLIDETINAVVRGSNENEFIKLANTNSTGKAADGMDGDDVIDGGVGSTFATGGGGSNTFFLDGRAEGVSWSTITDFKLGIDKATIWGWKQGVSKVSFIDEQGGADGYQGLTLHFENLLPDDAAPGQVNLQLNSITLTGLKLSDFGVSSLEELNALIAAGGNGNFQVGSVSDEYGDHGYLFLN